MRKELGFFLVFIFIFALVLTGSGCVSRSPNTSPTPSASEVPYKSLVENFIKTDATYAFDGIEGSLKFLKTVGSTSGNESSPIKEWEFTIEFQTRHPGEGNRSGQVLAQEITRHTAIIKVEDGQIVTAICDSIWNMLGDENLADKASAQRIAEEYISNSSTFKFDGIKGSIKSVNVEPGWSNVFHSIAVTTEYQTQHPGHGDRTGEVLAQVITNHSAVILVNMDKGVVAMAVCDKTWDMVNDKNPPLSVTGTIISGGDTTVPGGPVDAPRIFVYEVKRDDGTTIKVSYTAYPPSPVGDANRNKITLEFAGGNIKIEDRMEALGRIDKETNTIVVADQGDYIKTYSTQKMVISEDVSWQIGDTVVAATITRPDDKDVHPAVVFVAGSGPTDRDWNTPLLPGTNGSARLLAEELAKSGFITIRYDKRFTGPNAQKNMPLMTGKISMEGHVEELAGAVDQLLSRPDVDPQRIFVVANSEGNIHAMNYQRERELKFAGLVLIAPPGRKMTDIIHTQLEAQVASMPNAKEIMAAFDKGMAAFLAGEPFTADPILPKGVNDLIQSLYNPLNLPFTRELFLTDGSKLLSQVTAPVLVVIGKKDIQVDWQLDGAPLETVAKTMKNVTFVYPENANHVLKNESKPLSAITAADGLTYNAPDRVLDADGLKAIKDWLAARS